MPFERSLRLMARQPSSEDPPRRRSTTRRCRRERRHRRVFLPSSGDTLVFVRAFICLVGAAAAVLSGCEDDTSATGGPGGGGSGAFGPGSGAGTSSGGSGGGGGSTGGSGGGGGLPRAACDPLPAPQGNVIMVGPSDDVAGAVSNAVSGDTVMLAAGNYDLSGQAVWVGADGVTIRGATGNPEDVVLDGGYDTAGGGLISISSASNVTVSDLTIRRPRYHAIHVTGGDAPANDTLIYNVRLFDPGEQAIKINHASSGNYADDGEIACSHVELTEDGREQVMSYTSSGSNCYTGGVDAHGARGWTVRDNTIVGFWCSNADLSEHGVHFWTGSRDTVVVRNYLVDNARGIGFGLVGGGRTYDDSPCKGASGAGHYGGLIANNFVVATDAGLFASPNGVDTGIALWYACDATVTHNSVAFTSPPFSAIEWRFDPTTVTLVNNLTTHVQMERPGATATTEGNIADAPLGSFVDVSAADLHLADGASAIGAGVAAGATHAPEDIDGDMRPATPDVGADQR